MNCLIKCCTPFNGAVLTLAMLLPMAATAGLITPTSYGYGFTPGGATPAFQDPSNTKLTDGLTGSTDPSDGLWVGFVGNRGQAGEGMIFFNFASSVTITDVLIHFLRDDAQSIEVSPGVSVTVDDGVNPNNATIFSPVNFAADNTAGFIDFTGSWTGSAILVALGQDQSFPFVSEIEFNDSSSSAAPEPGTVGLALAGVVAIIGWGRKRSSLRS